MKTLEHQTYLAMRAGAEVLEADGRGDKVLRLADGSYLKLFRRKRLISSAAWYPYAQRFADNAARLRELGIPCPQIVEVYRIPTLARDAVHYLPLAGSTLRQRLRDGLAPDTGQALRHAFNLFVIRLHDLGIYFRSLHLGNVVLTPEHHLGLIDICDIRLHRGPLRRYWRARNLRRMQGIAGERDWLDCELIVSARPGAAACSDG